MSARRGTSAWCIAAGLLRIFSALSPAPMNIAGMDVAAEPQSPPPVPADMVWVQERRSDLELTKRLHKSTNDLDLRSVFVEAFVELIQDTATQSCCSHLYVGFTVIPIIGAAAGPDVSASAWHDGVSRDLRATQQELAPVPRCAGTALGLSVLPSQSRVPAVAAVPSGGLKELRP